MEMQPSANQIKMILYIRAKYRYVRTSTVYTVYTYSIYRYTSIYTVYTVQQTKSSDTGTRTQVSCVKGKGDNHLHYIGTTDCLENNKYIKLQFFHSIKLILRIK